MTEPHREAKATALRERAGRRRWRLLIDGAASSTAEDATRWHRSRARGQVERIDRVVDCGTTAIQVTCQACGRSEERASKCRVHLLCVSCRGRIACEKRARFRQARAAVLAGARDRGLLRMDRRGGRWSEKLITLTAPHLPGEQVADRIVRVLKAWRMALKSINGWLREIRSHASSAWFRVFEWTPGSDGRGHPHLHVWFFGPFVERERLRGWWCAALGVTDAIVDVREVRDSDGAATELVKYLTKDIDENGRKIPPELYAEVYKALDGARLTQASRGFMGLGKGGPAACECGATLPRRVRRAAKAAPQGTGAGSEQGKGDRGTDDSR